MSEETAATRYATCISETIYKGALTYGRRYVIRGVNKAPDRHNIKIQGDNGRVRWYPASHFDLTGAEVARLETVTIRDDVADANTSAIEVDLSLSDGQRRYCFFATPEGLKHFGDQLDGTNITIHYNFPHLIIVEQLDEAIIHQALRYIEVRGELFASTMAIDPPPDDVDDDTK